MARICLAGLGLALLLAMTGAGAAQAQRPQPPRPQPAQQAQPAQPAQPAPPAEAQPAPPPAPAAAPAAAEPVAEPPAPPPAATPAPAPLFEPRPQGPVPIRIVPSPKSEEELVAEQQDRAQRAALESNLTLLAVVLVAIGFLQLVIIAAQGLFLWIGLAAIRRPMELAERNLAFAQRAFVHVGSLAARTAGDNLRVTPNVENGGATPTRNLRISTNWRAMHGELPRDFSYNYAEPPVRIVLPARGRCDIGAVEIPMRDVQAAIEGRLRLYVWGRATYEDIFEGSEPHFVEFCYRLDVSGSTPDRVAVAFMPDGIHNRTEQDGHRSEQAGR